MKKTLKALISVVLVLCMMASTVVNVSAAWEEEYLSDLRLIYADTYKEAKRVLAETKLEGYKIFDENLNENTGKTGVWLAYKTTTNVNDAITDLAVMQMGGGYKVGNYQQVIEQAYDDYLEIGDIYVQAITYFADAYKAGNFLAKSAYRQFNFYRGIDNYENEPLGNLFVRGRLNSYELATLVLQGNSYVLENIRTLLAMGVSYNEDGMHYLEKVGASAAKVKDGTFSVSGKNYDKLAALIAPSIVVFRNMFEELSAYEAELNYKDETFTELEIKYSEYMAIAEMMRKVDYLDGKTLYDFCLNYSIDTNDYSKLYPLADALNEGQIAVTKLAHYYDVVRYSMSSTPDEIIDAELSKLEEKYAENLFDVYTGVDRTVYTETFALTNRAYRGDAYNENVSLEQVFFGDGIWDEATAQVSSGAIGVGLSIWEITDKTAGSREVNLSTVTLAIDRYGKFVQTVCEAVGGQVFKFSAVMEMGSPNKTLGGVVYSLLSEEGTTKEHFQMTFLELCEQFTYKFVNGQLAAMDKARVVLNAAKAKLAAAEKGIVASQSSAAQAATSFSTYATAFLNFSGAITSAYTTISLCKKIYNFYYPTYDDIPVSMMDLVNTEDGDKFVKYNVVYEATPQKDGSYAPGDLNAFKGQRWNALYFTKDANAGKPLLAEFYLSNYDNRPDEEYSAVHRFDEVICYDLNKYNFSSSSDSIFLTVEQSENEKFIAEAPDVVGSIFSAGFLFLAIGVGLVFGVTGTLGSQFFLKKNKKKDKKG